MFQLQDHAFAFEAMLFGNGEVCEEFNEDDHYVGPTSNCTHCLFVLQWIVRKVICSYCVLEMRHILIWFWWRELYLNQIL